MVYKFHFVPHSQLNNEICNEIIALKQQPWPHSYESQKNWILQNTLPDDTHLIMYSYEKPIAYLCLNRIVCVDDWKTFCAIGIGNVCVEQKIQGQGLGLNLVTTANEFIMHQQMSGILLCKTPLLQFYQKSGWQRIRSTDSFVVAGEAFTECVMAYNCQDDFCGILHINRAF